MKELYNYCHEIFSLQGANPQLGLIFGLLLQSSKPLSLGEIAESLDLSKASISLLIRQLTRLGYCRKLPKKKDRKDFYVVNEHHMEAVLTSRIINKRYQIEELDRLANSDSKEINSELRERLRKILRFEQLSCKSLESLLQSLKNENSVPEPRNILRQQLC